MKSYLIGIGVLVAVLIIAGALISKTNEPKKTFQATNIREISVEAFEMGFKLSSTTLKRGETVRIKLSNSGEKRHDFALDEMPNIKTKEIKSGETDMVEFTVPMTGELTYYCSVGSHRAQGMEGKFLIEE